MRAFRYFVLLCFIFNYITVSADVEHYFSGIKNNPDALYQFFKAMPKGGELHYHLAGGALPETMLSVARKGNYCIDPMTYTVNYSPITKNATKPCHGILLSQLKKDSELYHKIIQAWSLKDFSSQQETRHDHFFASFFKFLPIVSEDGPALLTSVMKRAAKQHEMYLEVMVLPDDAHSASFGHLIHHAKSFKEKQQVLLSNLGMQENIHNTIANSARLLQQSRKQLHCEKKEKDPACYLTVRLQYYILREQPIDSFFAQALNGFAATSQSNQLVSINLVQAEDGPISLHDYRKQMHIINFLHKAYPNVHIALHAGELHPTQVGTNKVNPKELTYHIHDAIQIGDAERIGHGTDIDSEFEHEKILNLMSKKEIPVEINLTSNQQLLNVSPEKNPIHHYLRHHVPIILSTDDEGILRTNLTKEYLKATTEQKLDYSTLKTINRNTLTFSFLPGKSIWKDAAQSIPVESCNNLSSPECLNFIAHNQKAKLQWQLEQKLLAFENQYHHHSHTDK